MKTTGRTDTLREVERDESEAISLLVHLLDNVRETSPSMVPESISKVVNKWHKQATGGTVSQRCEDRLNQRELSVHPEVLTLSEVAKLLRCSKAHLCNVLNGKVAGLPPLPCVSLGRRKLIRRAALERWIEQLEGVGDTDLILWNR